MKRTIFLLVAVLFTIALNAQEREFFPVDWKAIEAFVADNPDSVRNLVKRMTAHEIDTTLTYEQRRLAFYGQSYISKGEESSAERTLFELFQKEKYKEVVESTKKSLEINPLSLESLNFTVMAMSRTIQGGDTLTYSPEEVQLYANRVMRILNTIATTGDGSKEHPFAVTKVSDEYNFMRYYLNLWEIKSQFVTIAERPCDGFMLQEASEYYGSLEIYFDITRVFELEGVSLSPKSKKKK